jgi:hypothetical protein
MGKIMRKSWKMWRQSPQDVGAITTFLWKIMEDLGCRGNHHEIKGFDQENLEYGKSGDFT